MMRQRLLSIGDDYWIEDGNGQHCYRVDGKAVRVRDTFIIKDPHGHDVAKIKERKLRVRDSMKIDLVERSAMVKKALVGLRERYHVEVEDAPDLKVHGNILDHEYEIESDGECVARISKKWFRVRDTYGVQVVRDIDVVLALAVTVAVDTLSHD